MKKRTVQILLFCLILSSMILPAFADMGPKPSVHITLKNGPEEACYVTLLSTRYSTGPHTSVYRPDENGTREEAPSNYPSYYGDGSDYGVYLAFRDYEASDPEELYFLQTYGLVQEGTYRWGYYPPQTFKVLLYFPEQEAFAVTEHLCERYAFDSYFTIDLAEVDLVPGQTVVGLTAAESYDHTWELISLAARILITIGLELLVAWGFALRRKGQLICILLVNVVTQMGLNAGLNLYAYHRGTSFLILAYAAMELAVLLAECAAYQLFLTGWSDHRKKLLHVFRYALVANLISFAMGWGVARVIPGIF